jgi:hypothetical protein
MGIFWLSARLLSYKHLTCSLSTCDIIYLMEINLSLEDEREVEVENLIP